MRKIFRMKYEPCSGRCYAPGDVINLDEMGLNTKTLAELLDNLIKIHEPACGNEHLSYALDYCEDYNLFISSFIHYGSLELFTDNTTFGALTKLINFALDFYEGDEWATLRGKLPGLGHSVCEHGKDHYLVEFALKYSGLNEKEQDGLRRNI